MPTPMYAFKEVAAQFGGVNPGDEKAVLQFFDSGLDELSRSKVQEIFDTLLSYEGRPDHGPAFSALTDDRDVALPRASESVSAEDLFFKSGSRRFKIRGRDRMRNGSIPDDGGRVGLEATFPRPDVGSYAMEPVSTSYEQVEEEAVPYGDGLRNLEEQISGIVCEVLGLPIISNERTLGELNADATHLGMIAKKLEDRFGIPIHEAVLNESQTVQGLVQYLLDGGPRPKS